jgi:3-phenylpropionate/cinnamic acid dioxygenase small subunit
LPRNKRKGNLQVTNSAQTIEPAQNTGLALHLELQGLRDELGAMLSYEAWLLDNDNYEDWLALLAPDVRYVAPVRRKIANEMINITAIDTLPSISSHFNDGLMQLQWRVKRFRTGHNHYDRPSALTCRVVSAPVLLGWNEVTGEARVSSSFLMLRAREEKEEATFAGGREDIWRKNEDGHWLLARRLIMLNHHIVPPLSILF